MHPTANIREQAATLADTLDLSEKEAEAYLHWFITGDDTRNRDIANWMNISPSMASRHLQRAKDYIDTTDDSDKAKALQQFLIRSGIGRTADKKHGVLQAKFGNNTFAVITTEQVDLDTEAYQLHIGWRDTNHSDEFINNMPESMTLPDEWYFTTLSGVTLTQLLEHTEYYLKNKSVAFDDRVYLTVFSVFRPTPVDSDWLTEKAIQTLPDYHDYELDANEQSA